MIQKNIHPYERAVRVVVGLAVATCQKHNP